MRSVRTLPPSLREAIARQHPEAFAAAINGGKSPSPFAAVVARASIDALTPSDNATAPPQITAPPAAINLTTLATHERKQQ